MIEECGNCKFEKDGECHRYPPTIHVDAGYMKFPRLLDGSFCGEWKPIPGGDDDDFDEEAGPIPYSVPKEE